MSTPSLRKYLTYFLLHMKLQTHNTATELVMNGDVIFFHVHLVVVLNNVEKGVFAEYFDATVKLPFDL